MSLEERIAKVLFRKELPPKIKLSDGNPSSLLRVVNAFVIRSTGVTRCLQVLLVIRKHFDNNNKIKTLEVTMTAIRES